MTKAQYIERDRKSLELLQFAMEKRGTDPRLWQAAMTQAELVEQDDVISLFRQDGSGRWVVGHYDHGTWREMGSFPLCYHAVKFLYAQFDDVPNPFDFRDEWEKVTGRTFSTKA
jgi:hypothetical protein